jgi:hypothetical protein
MSSTNAAILEVMRTGSITGSVAVRREPQEQGVVRLPVRMVPQVVPAFVPEPVKPVGLAAFLKRFFASP